MARPKAGGSSVRGSEGGGEGTTRFISPTLAGFKGADIHMRIKTSKSRI
jgi:hypothetical protein